MNYGAVQHAHRVDPSPVTIEKPRLQQQLDQLEKVLAECHHLVGSVEQATDRIIGAVPEKEGVGAAAPTPSTVEQRLAEMIGGAERLCGRLGKASQRLNTAV